MDKQHRAWLWPLALGLIGLFGFTLAWASTIWGAGLISDTFQYVSTARNLASGYGFQYSVGKTTLSLVHYPPLFPTVLAGFELAGIDALLGARIFNALLFGANAVLVGLSVYTITNSKVWGTMAALLTTFAAVLLGVHSWALSEPQYIFLGLLAWLLLANYLKQTQRHWLVLAGFVFGLAFMARYAGVAILAAAVLSVLLFSDHAWRRRIGDAVLLGTISIILPGLWALRIALQVGGLGARELQYIPLTAGNIQSLLNNILTWIVPFPLVNGREVWVLLGLLVGLVVFVWFVRRLGMEPGELLWPGHALYRLHLLYFWLYPVVVVAAKVFLDRGIGLNDRMLSPMFVSLIIVGVSLAARLWEADKRRWMRMGLVVGSLLFFAFYGFETTRAVRSFRAEGLGLARADWHAAGSIQFFGEFEDEEFYSNSPSTLYLWSNKPANNINSFSRMVTSADPDPAYVVMFKHATINKDVSEFAESIELVASDEIADVYYFVPVGE